MTTARRQLLITLSNIGDAVMSTPVLTAMHRLDEESVIDIVSDARSAEVFAPCPFRGEIILKQKKSGVSGLWRLCRALRRHRYERIVDLRTDGLSYLLRAGIRCNKWRAAAARGPHAVERLFAVIAHQFPEPQIPPVTLWLSDADREFARKALAGLPGDRWLALGPGANWPPKIWPGDRFQSLLKMIAADIDAVVLLGGRNDAGVCARIAAGTDCATVDLSGRTALLEAAAILERCIAFVGNDSGLGHLAAAVGTATLTLFGPGDPQRYRPWGERAKWIAAADGDMASITPARTAEVLHSLLAPHGVDTPTNR